MQPWGAQVEQDTPSHSPGRGPGRPPFLVPVVLAISVGIPVKPQLCYTHYISLSVPSPPQLGCPCPPGTPTPHCSQPPVGLKN